MEVNTLVLRTINYNNDVVKGLRNILATTTTGDNWVTLVKFSKSLTRNTLNNRVILVKEI